MQKTSVTAGYHGYLRLVLENSMASHLVSVLMQKKTNQPQPGVRAAALCHLVTQQSITLRPSPHHGLLTLLQSGSD